ncbi:MAG: DegT/DnrJ/EryC1/StrS family aminotransferase [Patescibacteria group bacterium]
MHNKIAVGGLIISQKAKQLVNQVLENNRLSYGPLSRQFEQEFATMHDSKYAVFCNSGTTALQIAVQALKEREKWRDDDEVIVPAITFIASSNVILQNNLKPVFVDVDLATYNIDPVAVENAITPRTRAIMPVHLMGLPCDMDPLWAIAKKHHLKIVEDSCESMLAEYHGKKVGSLGDIGCFSTYVAHLLVTGVGGLATTSDENLALRMRSLMNHGRDFAYLNIDQDDVAKGNKLFDIVERRFRYTSVGHSARCTELEAALGCAQLPDLPDIVSSRQKNALTLIKLLNDLQEELQLPSIPEGRTHSFMLFPLLLKKESKAAFIRYLESHQIETRYLMPLLTQPIYKRLFGNIEHQFPQAKKINRSGLYIGCHQYLNQQDLHYISDTIHAYFKKKKKTSTNL